MINFEAMTPEEWDVARRVADAVNIHIQANEDARGWVACSMQDGRSDGSLYDTRRDAVRHQRDESNCFYMKVAPGGITPKEAWVNVVAFRRLRDAGIRPDHEDVTLPQRGELLGGIAPRLLIPRQHIPSTFRSLP